MKRRKVQNHAVIGGQWGDEGKGKIIDVLADDADIVVRGTGGANAGHTILIGSRKYVLHLIPSGIVRSGKQNVIGNGMVVDPRSLCEELAALREAGIDYESRLHIALNAKLILPQHFVLEALHEAGKGAVGSTRRGVGPCYADHVARTGLIVNDIFNPKVFAEKLERNLEEKRWVFEHFGRRLVRKILSTPQLQHGRFYSRDGFLNVTEIVAAYRDYARAFGSMVCDTDAYLREHADRKAMLFEGAQGMYLSVDYGTYPYVTSSDPAIEGLMKGAGLPVSAAGKVHVVLKAPYETRVGKGAFPTEMGGRRSEEWCEKTTRAVEESAWPNPRINGSSEFERGITVRTRGIEFGATTGRLRRCGWLDAVLARHAMEINGGDMILTKLDVMSGCKRLRICTHYVYEGPIMRWGELLLRKGMRVDRAIPHDEVLHHSNPQYEELTGWNADISKAFKWKQLPQRCKRYVERVSELVGANVSALGVGADRDQMIWL